MNTAPGRALKESTAFARMLQQEGVNFVDVRIGSYETILSDPRGGAVYRQGTGMLYLSEAFKKTLSIPMFDVSRREHDPAAWEEAIAAGRCDVVLAMGYAANTHLYDAIKEKVPECYRIGDGIRQGRFLTLSERRPTLRERCDTHISIAVEGRRAAYDLSGT